MEPLLTEDPERYTLFPIKYPGIYAKLKQQRACFWVPEEVDFSKDIVDWETKLSDGERHFIKHVLAFFAGADGIVTFNILHNFLNEVKTPEVLATYSFQAAIEGVHSETYSIMIDALIKDPAEKARLFEAIKHVPCVRKKAEWALKWVELKDETDASRAFVKRLIAFAVVEGLFFSGAFASIYWIRQKHIMRGLTDSNSFIARDERLHTEFAIELYKHVVNRLSSEEVTAMVREAVEVEKEFIMDAIPCRLIGMNAELMSQYIDYVADRLLVDLGYQPISKATNPFSFMELIGIENKTNFLDKRSPDYQKAHVLNESKTIAYTDEF